MALFQKLTSNISPRYQWRCYSLEITSWCWDGGTGHMLWWEIVSHADQKYSDVLVINLVIMRRYKLDDQLTSKLISGLGERLYFFVWLPCRFFYNITLHHTLRNVGIQVDIDVSGHSSETKHAWNIFPAIRTPDNQTRSQSSVTVLRFVSLFIKAHIHQLTFAAIFAFFIQHQALIVRTRILRDA